MLKILARVIQNFGSDTYRLTQFICQLCTTDDIKWGAYLLAYTYKLGNSLPRPFGWWMIAPSLAL